MGSDRRSTPGALSRLLGALPGALPRAGFYAALRRIECAHRAQPRIGEALSPVDEPVRFGQDASLAFRGHAIVALAEADEGQPARLAFGFFGASGPQGPLPLHLTEYVQQRARSHADPTLGRFLDVFHHRLFSLLYRAWASGEPAVQRDRPARDRFARQLGALIGLRMPEARTETSARAETCLHLARHFANVTRHAEGLEKVLTAHFGVPAQVEERVGQWLPIPDAYRWRLPGSRPRGGAALSMLGESTRLGAEVWDVQAKFRVVLGPMGRAAYERFLPGAADFSHLCALITQYAGPELAWDVRLVLREPDRGACVLGVAGALGRTAHLGGGAPGASAAFEDLVLDPRAQVA